VFWDAPRACCESCSKNETWSLTDISKRINAQAQRVAVSFASRWILASVKGSISKVLSSLEEQLWIRRRDRGRRARARRLRSNGGKYKSAIAGGFTKFLRASECVGNGVTRSASGFRDKSGPPRFHGRRGRIPGRPFVELDRVGQSFSEMRRARAFAELSEGNRPGQVAMIFTPMMQACSCTAGGRRGSDRVQPAKLSRPLCARGRDLKQADYLLSTAIEPRWRSA